MSPSRLQNFKITAPDGGIDLKTPINLLSNNRWANNDRLICRDGQIMNVPRVNRRLVELSFDQSTSHDEQLVLLDYIPYLPYLFAVTIRGTTGNEARLYTITLASSGALAVTYRTAWDRPTFMGVGSQDTEYNVDSYPWAIVPAAPIGTVPNQVVFFCANQKLWKYTTAATVVVVPDLTTFCTNCHCVTVYQRHVIIANLEETNYYPNRWRWSAYNDFDVWTPTATNMAGAADLEAGEIIYALEHLKDRLFMYTNTGIHMITYVGFPSIWRRDRIVTNVGVAGRKCVANFGDFHIFVSDIGNKNVYIFDGMGVRPIGEQIRDEMFAYIIALQNNTGATINNRATAKALARPDKNEAWFFVPYAAGDGYTYWKEGFIYNYKQNSWSKYNFYHLKIGASTSENWSWDRITCISSPRITLRGRHYIGVGGNSVRELEAGTGDYSMQKGDITGKLTDLGNPSITKRVQRVRIAFNQSVAENMNVYIGTAEGPNQAISWSSAFTISMATANVWLDCDITARYFSIKFEVAEYLTGTQFKMSEYEWYFIPKSMV